MNDDALCLRPMRAGDIATVAALDRLCFATPWSERAFRYEVCEADCSHMVVLERAARPGAGVIEGYGGLWVIEDEGHISTLAVQPAARGRRWGELLLTAMIERARAYGAAYIALEARVSNRVALRLYRKYGFAFSERRPRYYADREDAFSMRLELDARGSAEFAQRRAALRAHFAARRGLRDFYTGAPLAATER